MCHPMAMPHVNRAPWQCSAARALVLVACKRFGAFALCLVVGGDVTRAAEIKRACGHTIGYTGILSAAATACHGSVILE